MAITLTRCTEESPLPVEVDFSSPVAAAKMLPIMVMMTAVIKIAFIALFMLFWQKILIRVSQKYQRGVMKRTDL